MAITYDSVTDRLVITDPGADGTSVIKMRATVPGGALVDSNQFNVVFAAAAAILSAPTASAITTTTATLQVTTNGTTGLLYAIADANTSQPSALQIIAGQNAASTNALYRPAAQAISSAGQKSFNATGFTAGQSYSFWFVHVVSGQNSNVIGAAFQAAVTGPTLTKNLVTESMFGHDSPITWQSVYLLNDGRIASFGTGNHAPNQSNAMRIIDPIQSPGSLTTYQDFPWTQIEGTEGNGAFFVDNTNCGTNRYCTNFDNYASMYIPSDNRAIWAASRSVFDFTPGVKSWVLGDRTPNTQDWNQYIDLSAYDIDGTYNPIVAWCSALDKGVWWGGSGGGFSTNFVMVERNTPGNPKPWKLTRTTIPNPYRTGYSRNGGVCIGTDFYAAALFFTDSGPAGPPLFFKVDLITKTVTADLAPWTISANDYYPQLIHDTARNRLLMLGVRLQEYNLTTNVWTDITPSNWGVTGATVGFATPMGVYHPKDNAVYFRGANSADRLSNVASAYQWHKLTFPQTGFSRYRAITINAGATPFGGAGVGNGISKHVFLKWHPTKRRLYQLGGDYQGGATLVTADPAGSHTYTDPGSLENDMYSMDPYATSPISWRLEHPYLPRNMGGGVREARMGRPDQVSMVWDTVRSKFWCFQSVLRTEFLHLLGGVPDLWANGDMTTSGVIEPIGTYSWTPGTSGSPGTWTFETSNRLTYRLGAGTSYNGGQLISGFGDERIGLLEYDAKNDVCACISANGGGSVKLFTFHPATKTYEHRNIPITGYNELFCGCSYQAFVDGWVYAVAYARDAGANRRSIMIRVNVTASLAVANQGTVSASAGEALVLPWSLSPGGIWESANNSGAKWSEHCGVIAINRKVFFACSYDGVIDGGVTKMTTWDPDSRTFTPAETAPENFVANSWTALPETGEVLMGLGSSEAYSRLKMWAYRVGGPQGSVPVTPPSTSYSTSFPLTENPISEGSQWINGAATGGQWNNVRTTTNKAFGSAFVGASAPQRYADDIAILTTGALAATPAQYAQATTYKAAGYAPGDSHEVELLFRFSIVNGNAHGYEVLRGITAGGAQGYWALVRWDGGLGFYTPIWDPGPGSSAIPQDGDVVRVEMTAAHVCTIKLNGATVHTENIAAFGGTLWSTGQPGMGFWPLPGTTLASYGWKDFTAGNL